MLSILKNQSGYGRLTAGTVTLAVVAIAALSYQVWIANRPSLPTFSRSTNPVATSIQLFPQSLPVLERVGYSLEVENADGDKHRFPKLFHREQGNLVFSTGEVIEDGVIDLPASFSDVAFVRLSLFDDRIIQQPILIPFLQGEVENDRTFLSFVDTDFTDSSGQFSLATPTDNNALVNERSGLWFGDVIKNESKLVLPSLPQGWVYEGWAVIDDQPLTTGRFRNANQADRFSGFSDESAAPPDFPGEDFLQDPPVAVFPDLAFPVDLAGQQVMLSIEPDVNGRDLIGEDPFPMTVLKRSIPSLAQAGVLYDLEYSPELFPKVTVVIRFSS